MCGTARRGGVSGIPVAGSRRFDRAAGDGVRGNVCNLDCLAALARPDDGRAMAGSSDPRVFRRWWSRGWRFLWMIGFRPGEFLHTFHYHAAGAFKRFGPGKLKLFQRFLDIQTSGQLLLLALP